MDENQKPKSSMSLPVAIVIAGAMIAGAVYLSNTSGTKGPNTNQQAQGQDTGSETIETDLAIRPISDTDHALGNPTAKLAIVVFTDTECPFCKSFHMTMNKVSDTYGKNGSLLWVYRHFPIQQLHPRAPKEAEATECAAELGGKTAFWSFMNKIFEITPSNNGLEPSELPKIASGLGINTKSFNSCLESGKYTEKIQKDTEEAVNAGGRGTPYSIFVARKPLSATTQTSIKTIAANFPPDTFLFSKDDLRVGMSGALPYATVQLVIDALLAN